MYRRTLYCACTDRRWKATSISSTATKEGYLWAMQQYRSVTNAFKQKLNSVGSLHSSCPSILVWFVRIYTVNHAKGFVILQLSTSVRARQGNTASTRWLYNLLCQCNECDQWHWMCLDAGSAEVECALLWCRTPVHFSQNAVYALTGRR